MENTFSKEEKDSAALFIRMYKNSDGSLNKNSEIARVINSSEIPIFVTDSLFVKRGAFGGRIVDLNTFGEKSAKLAIDILNGETNKTVVFDDLTNVFDYQKLIHFGASLINIKNLYTLVNRKLTFSEKYRGLIDFVFTISPLFLFLILGLIHNIYMRKQVEKDLRRRIEFDATLLNAIESPILWEDSKGIIVDSNNNFCKLLGLSSKELYKKSLIDFKDKTNVKNVIAALEKYKNNEDENNEFSYTLKDSNEKKIYLIKQKEFSDEKIESKGLVTIFTDITKQKEIALEKQKNRQFVIQQSKLAEIGEVFSSIAHQWKSPLIEITAIAQELFYTRKCNGCEKGVTEDESFVKDIMNQVTYMTNTINDFQKFIMPSNKKLDFNIYDAVKSMLEIVNHNIKYNNIKIDIDVKEDTKLIVNGYKNEIMQSLLNIVNNAKDALLEKNNYKNRNIEIKLFNENKYLVITIKDNAGGIDEKSMNEIFNPYFTTKEHGHGIGLYMSKVIIEDKMGGSIFVKNAEDGAIFTIRLDQSI